MKNFFQKYASETVNLIQFSVSIGIVTFFVLCGKKFYYDWELWAFITCVIVYGLTNHLKGFQKGLQASSNFDIPSLVKEFKEEIEVQRKVIEKYNGLSQQEILDTLLDKISKEGKGSLTPFEKSLLEQVSK